MDRRTFAKQCLAAGAGVGTHCTMTTSDAAATERDEAYVEPSRELPVRKFDVVVAGGGTAGVVAAVAAARQGARTAAALCAARNLGTRELSYAVLREALARGGVYFES